MPIVGSHSMQTVEWYCQSTPELERPKGGVHFDLCAERDLRRSMAKT